MKYTVELTADEARALEETMRLVRKGGDARLVARSKAGASLARKVEELRDVVAVVRGRHFPPWLPPDGYGPQRTILPPRIADMPDEPLPSTPVVAPTTLVDSE